VTAPAGATIDPATGAFAWTPAEFQGPTTYVLRVRVTDNGAPSLSQTKSFQITVRDVLPDFVVSIGWTNLLAGQTGMAPIQLLSGAKLTNLTFTLSVQENRLTNLAFVSPAADVASADLTRTGSNLFAVRIASRPGIALPSGPPLVQLGFTAVTSQPSAFVPLLIAQLEGSQTNGLRLANALGQNGRVVVIGAEPLLEIPLTEARKQALILYGRPGTVYAIQAATNLAPTASWQSITNLSLTNIAQVIPAINTSAPRIFYRAAEIAGPPPLLQISPPGGPRLSLLLHGRVGAVYQLQYTTNLSDRINWLPAFSVRLTNSTQLIPGLTNTSRTLFYRLRVESP
jgi:hypothetical protein